MHVLFVVVIVKVFVCADYREIYLDPHTRRPAAHQVIAEPFTLA